MMNEDLFLIVTKANGTTFFQKISNEKSNVYLFKTRGLAERYKLMHLYNPENFEAVESSKVDFESLIASMKKVTQIEKVIVDKVE